MGNCGDKKSLFLLACYAVRGAMAFLSTYIDLALTSNKTNEGVKKQWDGHRVEVRVLTAA